VGGPQAHGDFEGLEAAGVIPANARYPDDIVDVVGRNGELVEPLDYFVTHNGNGSAAFCQLRAELILRIVRHRGIEAGLREHVSALAGDEEAEGAGLDCLTHPAPEVLQRYPLMSSLCTPCDRVKHAGGSRGVPRSQL
jgi:hypothetical protein